MLTLLILLKSLAMTIVAMTPQQEPLGEYWGTGESESKYYKLVDIPLPDELAVEAGSFEVMPDQQRLAIATRRGDIFLVDGALDKYPEPTFSKFASGLDEIFGMAYRDGAFYATQQTEVTRISDTNGDGRADQFDTLSDRWGFRDYHEFAFGSKPDAEGNIWVALCLSKSYHSDAPFRGWCLKITPDGKSIPVCSGIRSPCGIGPNEHGVMFYAESQGPWNGSCSLKVLEPGGFMGHPVSFNWYELAPELGPSPVVPNTPSRLETERQRVKELVPYAVVFPYKRMGRSISGYMVDRTGGKFGPFENQIFIGDFSLGVVMRATTEKVNGVWQGACYPFREGFDTGLLAVQFTPNGNLIAGGTNRGWPVRGPKAYAVQRLDWTGLVPFEIKEIKAHPEGFEIAFTKPVNREVAKQPENYQLKTFTHIYRQGYGSPEVDQTTPRTTKATVSDDGMRVNISVDGLVQGHVHDFYLPEVLSTEDEKLLHSSAYYTLNEIPKPVDVSVQTPEDDLWINFPGGEGPGKGKRIVLIAAEQEYRSEQSMPMLAKVLSEHHGFDCTVLFSVNGQGEVDPTMPAPLKNGPKHHHIPGLEQLADADCVIWLSRFMQLPDDELKHFHDYFDSGKPLIALRTANHGLWGGTKYVKDGKNVTLRELLGGTFMGHHGGWHRESTRGVIVPENISHPILRGVTDIWGPSDVYRCHNDKFPFPEDWTALVMGQPLVDLTPGAQPNADKEPLPVAWTKNWVGKQGLTSRIFHFTMGSAKDFENEGVRRLTVNAVYWGLGMEDSIEPERSVEIVGKYEPLKSGFNYEKLGVQPRSPNFYATGQRGQKDSLKATESDKTESDKTEADDTEATNSVQKPGPLKVFLLIGQSNMQGHAHVRTLPHVGMDPVTKPLLSTMVDQKGNPRLIKDVWISSLSSGGTKTGQLTTGFGADANKIGPELTFGIRMQERLNEPVLIIKAAWGGKSLHTDFRSPSAGAFEFSDAALDQLQAQGKDVALIKSEKLKATGVYFSATLKHVENVLSDIKTVYPEYDTDRGYELAGAVWFQGWNDMVDRGVYPVRDQPNGYQAYSVLLGHFIRDLRKGLAQFNLVDQPLPIVIGVIGVGGPTADYLPAQQRYRAVHQGFRDAMQEPAKLDEFKDNVVAVLTEKYWDQELDGIIGRQDLIRNRIRKSKQAGELELLAKEIAAANKLSPSVKPEFESLRSTGKLEQAIMLGLSNAEFSEREREILTLGKSNAAYHYLGCAKIMAQIGNAFADAMPMNAGPTDAPQATVAARDPTVSTKGIIDFQRPQDALQLIGESGSKMLPESDVKCKWVFNNGVLTASPKWDSVITPEPYLDFRLHLDFNLNDPGDVPRERSGNSGIYIQQRYELQILNSFGVAESDYKFTDCGCFYGQKKPDALVCKPPGEWQSLDIAFRAARFDGDQKTEHARATVFLNEVLIHDDYVLKRKTGAGKKENATPYPIKLQGHHNPVQFRDMWIQRLALD